MGSPRLGQLVAVLGLAACGRIGFDPSATQPDAAAPFSLTGAIWQLPCLGAGSTPAHCACGQPTDVQAVPIAGAPSERWTITVSIRGALELHPYTGGPVTSAPWYSGGTPSNMVDNVYRLSVSSPAAVYFINHQVVASTGVVEIDYTVELPIDGGATVTFGSDPRDGEQWRNSAPITFDDISNPVQPYDGQFARLDVLFATRQ